MIVNQIEAKKMNELDKKRLYKRAFALLDRADALLEHINTELEENTKKAA